MKKLSIVYPVQSLSTDVFVAKAIKSYNAKCKKAQLIQHIVITSEAKDKVFDEVTVKFLQTQSRGERLNAGIELCEADLVLFHHPRSLLEPEGVDYLIDYSEELNWGGFTHEFDEKHWGLQFTSWYSNHIRGRFNGIYYLDHCLYSKKSLIKKSGGFPNIDIFEDTIFCQRLMKISKPVRLPFRSVTSAVRFSSNGFWKQSFLNQKLKWGFYFKKDHRKMNADYEKNLNLNSHYEE